MTEPTAPASTDLSTPPDTAPSPSVEALPEHIPLTPELVEDEAQRGDFVLRWAAILFALMLGFTHVADSSVLTRIRSGEYIASHGMLPPRVDPFSSSASDRTWVNLGWLGDLALAAIHKIGGEYGLTLWSALLAGGTCYVLSRITVPGISTWWCSVCSIVATVACFPLLTPGDGLTLLGVAMTLYLLQHWQTSPQCRGICGLIPLMFLWSNSDKYAFLGLWISTMYLTGVGLSWLLTKKAKLSVDGLRLLGMAVGLAWLAAAVHPFHWHAWASPATLFRFEYPEIREYFTLGPHFAWLWQPLEFGAKGFLAKADLFQWFWVVSLVLAVIAMLLNFSEESAGWMAVVVLINGLAVMGMHLIPAAAVVNAITAIANGQWWYRSRGPQTYTTNSKELFFSRAGRALTVVALFTMSWMAISGRLMGPSGRRLGIGFDWEIRSAITSLQDLAKDGFVDQRPFNFRLEQGDILNWIGERPFVDSRVNLFAQGTPNLLQTHRAVRNSLVPRVNRAQAEQFMEWREKKQKGTLTDKEAQRFTEFQQMIEPMVWKNAFRDYHLTHVLPRLVGQNPDYSTFNTLVNQVDTWQPTKIGIASAVIYLRDPKNEKLLEFLKRQNNINFRDLAFGDQAPPEDDKTEVVPIWPHPPSQYDKWLMLPEPAVPQELQLAEHYDQIRREFESNRTSLQITTVEASLAILAIRHARLGLQTDPANWRGYRVLGNSYLALGQIEQIWLAAHGVKNPSTLRFRQAKVAYHLGALCDPNNAEFEYLLLSLSQASNCDDTLRHLDRIKEIRGHYSRFAPDQTEFRTDELAQEEMRKKLKDHADKTKDQIDKLFRDGKQLPAAIQAALGGACPRLALQLMESDLTLTKDPKMALQLATLRLETGRVEEAWNDLRQIEAMLIHMSRNTDGSQYFQLRSEVRATLALVEQLNGNSLAAAELMTDQAREMSRFRVFPFMGFVPGACLVGMQYDSLPFMHPYLGTAAAATFPEEWATLRLQTACQLIEAGQRTRATEVLKDALEFVPDNGFRPVIAFYLSLLTAKPVETVGPAAWIPVWGGMFVDQESPEPQK